jgi:hypothetical protein
MVCVIVSINIFKKFKYNITEVIFMAAKAIGYTATLPLNYVEELRAFAKEKKAVSINSAINEAVSEYLQNKKAVKYEAAIKAAANDNAFVKRTLLCVKDFKAIDSEVSRL